MGHRFGQSPGKKNSTCLNIISARSRLRNFLIRKGVNGRDARLEILGRIVPMTELYYDKSLRNSKQ